jgi:monofunctional biosynthetic peptidoglycan transglycosylase
VLKIVLKILLGFLSLGLIAVGYVAFIYLRTNVDQLNTKQVEFNSKNQNYELLKLSKNWTPIDQISTVAKWAIVISEDWAFYEHNGIDFNQLEIVIEESLEEKELVRGASTITQQVAKNLYLSNERSLFRKIKEAIIAYKLERNLSKEVILAHYLNLIHLGEGIHGIKQASRHYFNKSPSNLSAREGAFLAMLLPSPVKYSTSFRKKELTPFATKIIESVLKKLKQAKVITVEQMETQLETQFNWETSSFDSYL